jgi:hypothetical protein
MMSLKAAASLTGSLLARKGAAYPASYSAPTPSADSSPTEGSTPRAYNDPRVIASAPPSSGPLSGGAAPAHGDQLQDGRLASSEQPDKTPATTEFHTAHESADPIAGSDEAVDSVGLPQTMDKMGRVRLSVRLDPDRYLRVKMASARTRWSAQDIVIAALDRYLGGKSDSGSDDGNAKSGGNHGDLN